jgi:hypothetical protein
MTRKTQKPITKEIAEGQPPESTPEPKSEPLPGLGGASPILKPSGFSLDGFRSKRSASIGGVATLPASLSIMRLSEAKDYIRLHPNEAAYWSDELCLVHVPTKGVRGGSLLHLILEDLACAYLPEGKIIRHRLALASKPDDVFFLAEIPSTNLDNSWNASTLEGAEVGKTHWVQLTSLKNAGQERYKVDYAKDQDAFEEPTWLTQPLAELIGGAFSPNRAITLEDHPGLLRLIGAKQQLK